MGLRAKRIIVPVDGSVYSFRAAREAMGLARRSGGTVLAISVVHRPRALLPPPLSGPETYSYLEGLRRAGELYVKRVEGMGRRARVKVRGRVLTDVSVVKAICDEAKRRRAGLIVMGRRGKSDVGRLLLGSVSAGVATHAPCSVLIVR